MRRDLRDDDISNLQTMGTLLNDTISKMEEFGLTDTQRYKTAVDTQGKVIDRFSKLVSPVKGDDDEEDDEDDDTKPQFVNVKTQKEGDNERLEAEKDYYVTFTDNKGKQRSKKMTGRMASNQVNKYGNTVNSYTQLTSVIGKSGLPNINVGAKVKDMASGKTLRYTGIQKNVLGNPAFLQFEDSDGKTVNYTYSTAYKNPFGVISSKEESDFDTRYAQREVRKDDEEGWIDWAGEKIKGLTQTAAAAQQERRKKAEERKKKIQGKQKGGVIADTTQARLDEIDKILGEVPSEVTME
jgi:hypothetical protein